MYKLINLITRTLPFPKKGWKYFQKWMRKRDLDKRTYLKKIDHGLFMFVIPEDHIQQQIFWYGYYDKHIVDLMRKFLTHESIFIDVGANIGYYSLIAAKIATNGKVIAIEPFSQVYKKLLENIRVNELTNIQPVNVALSDKNTDATFYLSSNDNSGMSSLRPPENYSGNTEIVKVVTLDDWIFTTDPQRIDLIKLDIEGSELAALRGMRNSLQKFKPALIIELNADTLRYFNVSINDVLAFIHELGYVPFPVRIPAPALSGSCNNALITENAVFIHRSRSVM